MRIILIEYTWQVSEILAKKYDYEKNIVVSLDSESSYILKKNNQHGAAYETGTSEFPRLKIENLYDSTGIAKLYKISDPYHTLKVGDILILE